MSRWTRFAAVVILAAGCLLLATCGAKPAAEIALVEAAPGWRIAPEATDEPDRKMTFMWRLTQPGDSRKQLYLFGSIHSARPDFYPLDPAVEAAFDASDALVVEVDPQEMDAAKMKSAAIGRALLPAGVTLKDRLNAQTWTDLERWLGARKISLGAVMNFEPWFAALLVIQTQTGEVGLDPGLGLDLHFIDRAGAAKPIEALETFEDQIGFLDGLSPELQEWVLVDALDDLSAEGLAELDRMISAWKAGDAAAIYEEELASCAEDPRYKALYQAIVVRRNERMSDAIDDMLDDWNRLFVVVGAGHLVGGESVVALLEKRGYAAEQIASTQPR